MAGVLSYVFSDPTMSSSTFDPTTTTSTRQNTQNNTQYQNQAGGVGVHSYKSAPPSVPYQIDYSYQNTGRHISPTKRRVWFKFGFAKIESLARGRVGYECRGSEHEIEMIWSHASGKRAILLDGNVIHRDVATHTLQPWQYDFVMPLIPGEHRARIDGHAVVPISRHSDPTFRQFDLHIDGQSYFDFCKIYQLGTPPMMDEYNAAIQKFVERNPQILDGPSAPPPASLPSTDFQLRRGDDESTLGDDEDDAALRTNTTPPRRKHKPRKRRSHIGSIVDSIGSWDGKGSSPLSDDEYLSDDEEEETVFTQVPSGADQAAGMPLPRIATTTHRQKQQIKQDASRVTHPVAVPASPAPTTPVYLDPSTAPDFAKLVTQMPAPPLSPTPPPYDIVSVVPDFAKPSPAQKQQPHYNLQTQFAHVQLGATTKPNAQPKLSTIGERAPAVNLIDLRSPPSSPASNRPKIGSNHPYSIERTTSDLTLDTAIQQQSHATPARDFDDNVSYFNPALLDPRRVRENQANTSFRLQTQPPRYDNTVGDLLSVAADTVSDPRLTVPTNAAGLPPPPTLGQVQAAFGHDTSVASGVANVRVPAYSSQQHPTQLGLTPAHSFPPPPSLGQVNTSFGFSGASAQGLPSAMPASGFGASANTVPSAAMWAQPQTTPPAAPPNSANAQFLRRSPPPEKNAYGSTFWS